MTKPEQFAAAAPMYRIAVYERPEWVAVDAITLEPMTRRDVARVANLAPCSLALALFIDELPAADFARVEVHVGDRDEPVDVVEASALRPADSGEAYGLVATWQFPFPERAELSDDDLVAQLLHLADEHTCDATHTHVEVIDSRCGLAMRAA